MDLTSGENQFGRAVNENGGIRTDQGIPIRLDLGSTDLSKAIGRHLVYCLTKYVSYSSGGPVYSSAQAGLSTARPRKSCEFDHKRELALLYLGSSKPGSR
ncbi:hypothetical protein Taro_013110 [Colocasia esculenta]|uniref:Uncharacterized protein n=1 Tax=Colocasia esculenta TaxID=4460 RepID=A0A843UL59_COLES|nr:hypothetical protein [Colocasia esculenta]